MSVFESNAELLILWIVLSAGMLTLWSLLSWSIVHVIRTRSTPCSKRADAADQSNAGWGNEPDTEQLRHPRSAGRDYRRRADNSR